MILLPEEVRRALPPLYATESTPIDDKQMLLHFFTPWSSWDWYAVEGEEREDDFVCFGWVVGHEPEWGYFSINEMQALRGPAGVRVERDMHWTPCTFRELRERRTS